MKNLLKTIFMFLLVIIILPSNINAEEGNSTEIEILSGPSRVEKSISRGFEKDINYILNGYEINKKQSNLKIPFKTIKKNDNTLEKGSTKIRQEGIDGVKTVTDRIILKNNEVIDRRNIASNIVKASVDKVILVGTKEEEKIKKEYLYFITQNLNLRETASSGSKSLIKVPKGTHLDCLSSKNGWYKVKYKDKIGYLSSKSVKRGSGYRTSNILIVNKGYPLSNNFNSGVNSEALNAVNNMKRDASKSGIKLNVFSDFRTYQYQVKLYNRYVKRDGKKKADTYSARPGYSEHQTGLTFDIGGANSKYYTSLKLGQMKEGLWMAKNSYKYGLILRYPKGKEGITGYGYEPWHFRYIGVEIAKKVKDSGLTLDEYFGVVKADY